MDQIMNVRVPMETYLKLKEFAEKDDRTLHQVIRMALREFLAKVDCGYVKLAL